MIGAQFPVGIPFTVTPNLPDDFEDMIMADGGKHIIMREGSIIGDRVQYGWVDGPFIGPIKRYERDRDRLYNSAMKRINDGYKRARVKLHMLEVEFKRGY